MLALKNVIFTVLIMAQFLYGATDPIQIQNNMTRLQLQKLSGDRINGFFGVNVDIYQNTAVVANITDKVSVYEYNEITAQFEKIATLGTSNINSMYISSVAIYEDTIVVGDYLDNNRRGIAYVYSKPDTGWQDANESAILRASDASDGDEFGISVDIDLTTIVVGARSDDDNGSLSGSAYVFKSNAWSGTVNETLKIRSSEASSNDYFGASVAVYSNRILVGAYGQASDAKSLSGAAYLFESLDSSWSSADEIKILKSDNPQISERFGRSVDLSYSYAVVGVWLNSDIIYNGGAAYVFSSDNSWNHEITLRSSDMSKNDNFGKSVSISFDKIVVGASGNNNSQGSTYYFEKGALGWNRYESKKLIAKDLDEGDNFGSSVAIYGRFIISSAYLKNGNTGATYIFKDGFLGSVDEKDSKAYDINVNNENSGNFVYSIVGGEDMDRFNIGSLTGEVSFKNAPDFENPTDNDLNNIYNIIVKIDYDNGLRIRQHNLQLSVNDIVYEEVLPKIATYEKLQSITLQNQASSDLFGYAVASKDKIIAISSTGRDAVYLYKMQNTGVYLKIATLTYDNSIIGELSKFGSSLAVSSDTVVVGAYDYNDSIGIVFVYEKPDTGWEDMMPSAILSSSKPSLGMKFGADVAMDNNTIVVSAYQDSSYDWVYDGSIYIYEKSSQHWSDMNETTKITSPDKFGDLFFGFSIDINDNKIIVGANGANSNSGAAYLFCKEENGWSNASVAKLTPIHPIDVAMFGYSVAIEDDTVVVGSPNINSNTGAVYIFKKPLSGWIDKNEDNILYSDENTSHSYFGYRVDIDRDLIAVSMSGINTNQGAIYLFEDSKNGYSRKREFVRSPAQNDSFFGFALVIEDDKVISSAAGGSGEVIVYEGKRASSLSPIITYLLF